MNVFDWLSALPLHDSAKPYPVIEVTFNKGSRKDFFRNNTGQILEKGEWIAVEGIGGFDIGQVSLTGELVKLQMKKYSVNDDPQMKRVLRQATAEDMELYSRQKDREPELLTRSRAIARNLNLEMKLCEVEVQADGKKATFFYTAEQRVDFRELIKLYAGDFKVKVEMRQIGARQESGKVGGIGSCGRELCCSTWLTDFKSVNTTAARYQNLSINQTKLSGQCGRLKCCLNYELDTYMDALRVFPDNADALETAKGKAYLQKRDIFKNLMWYSYSDSNKQYPMTIVRVKEILKLNKEGIKPEELQPVELEVSSNKAGMKVDVGFVNDVGQISLKALEKGNKKKSNKGAQQQKAGQSQGQRPQGARPQQQADSNKGLQPQRNHGGQQGQKPNRPQQQTAQQKPQGNRPQQEGKLQRNLQPRPQQQGGETQQRNQQPNRPQQQGGESRQQRPQGNRPQQGESKQQGEHQQKPQQNRPNRPQNEARPPSQAQQSQQQTPPPQQS